MSSNPLKNSSGDVVGYELKSGYSGKVTVVHTDYVEVLDDQGQRHRLSIKDVPMDQVFNIGDKLRYSGYATVKKVK